MRLGGSTFARAGQRPWFDRRPRDAIGVAAALFVAIFVLRISTGDERDAIAMLYVLPISLVAIGFGRRAGIGAGATAVGLLVSWVLLRGVSLSLLGWVSRVTPLLLVGALIGGASDRMRAADEAERRAAAVALLQLEGAEINDTIVQSLAAAKWAIEAGDHERGLTILDDTIVEGQRLVTRVLGADSVVPEALRRSHRVRRSAPSAEQPRANGDTGSSSLVD
jgi:hypothetical protein